MPYPLKYNTASQEIPLGYFLDSTDGNTEEIALTIANSDIKLHKAGATTLANKNIGGGTHISNGIYYTVLDVIDTNTYGPLTIFVHVAGALAVKLECVVMDALVYDSLYGSDKQQIDIVQCGGATVPAGAIPNAAADGVGGLPISDAGGLNLDTQLANTNEITVARMAALTDWINGGRLDLILDIIAADVVNLDGAVMRGTDGGALASVATEARLAELDAANIPTDLSDIQGAAFNSATASLKAIRDRGDSAWVTGGGGSNPVLLQSTTIAVLTSQTSFTLTAGSSDDGAYNDAIIVITDAISSVQKAFGIVLGFIGATKTVTLASDPGIFTMAAGDVVDIVAIPKIVPTTKTNTDMRGTDGANTTTPPTVSAIRQEMDANSVDLNQIISDIAAVKVDTAAILIDTAELQGDWTNGGRLDVILDAILADTGTAGVVLTAAERTAIADAILDRDMSTGTDSGSALIRTVRQALRSGRNKIVIAGGTMTVYKEDDTTAAWTAAITTAAGNPISGIDPV